MPASTNTENKKQNEKGIKMQRQQSRSSQFKVSADRKKRIGSECWPLRFADHRADGRAEADIETKWKKSLYRKSFDFRFRGRSRIRQRSRLSRPASKRAPVKPLSVMFKYPDIFLVGRWRFQPPLVSALKGRLPRLENAGPSTTALSVQTGAAFFVACGVV